MREDVKRYLTKREIANYHIFFYFGLIFIVIPYFILTLPLTIIFGSVYLWTDKVPDWVRSVFYIPGDTYYRVIGDHYHKKAIERAHNDK